MVYTECCFFSIFRHTPQATCISLLPNPPQTPSAFLISWKGFCGQRERHKEARRALYTSSPVCAKCSKAYAHIRCWCMIKLSPHSAPITWDTRAAELKDKLNLTKRKREILREGNEWKGEKQGCNYKKGIEREREREESRAKQGRGRKRGEERGEKSERSIP